jgi:hypothetical protein
MDAPATETEVSLFGGPLDGKTLCYGGRPYELWMPVDPRSVPAEVFEIDPSCYCLAKQWVAVYARVADKNQYQYLEMLQV